MKNTIEAEDLRELRFVPFAEPEQGSVELKAASAAAVLASPEPASAVLDNLLATIKWIFLFLPGTAAMHCWVMMLSLFALSGTGPQGVWLESVGGMIIYSFIILLGLGKLSDLRYLKVIGAILSSSILLSVAIHATSFFSGYSNFGWAVLLTLPITIAFAQFIKIQIDKGESL